MIKEIKSEEPDYSNMKQILRVLKGKLGVDKDDYMWLCGVRLGKVEWINEGSEEEEARLTEI
jgi:hypothetical protein